jgi:hypothetical protein
MAELILIWVAFLVFVAPKDPAPGLLHSKTATRNLECERLSVEEAARAHPGEVAAPGPRGDLYPRSALVCTGRFMRLGLRSNKDEAILSALDQRTRELALAADSLRPNLEGSTWLVEAYYPGNQMASKIAFATKNALVAQGLRVSDRTPILAVGDIQVITRMAPDDAYPAACRRYFDNGSLGPDDVLLGVISRDRRETVLHAGICTRGQWTWLR